MAVMVLYVCKVSPGFESDAIAEIYYCFLQNWIFRLLSPRQVS